MIPEKIEVVSEEEAEECDAVICMPADTPSPFEDNMVGRCSVCSREVIYRPHAPKRPPKICLPCFMEVEGQEPCDIVTSKPMADDVRGLHDK